jgi:hypothetical protein
MKRKDLIRLAKALIGLRDPNAESARRYLSFVRRERVIRKGIEKLVAAHGENHPLGIVKFVMPLDVAGSSPAILKCAKELLDNGYPVVLDHSGSDKGGTHIDELCRRFRQRGEIRTDSDVMELFKSYLRIDDPRYIHLKRLARVCRRKAAKIGKVLDSALEGQSHRRRFCVVFRREDLEAALERIPITADQTLVLGFNGKGNPLMVQGYSIPTLEGEHSGAQNVFRADLEGLLRINSEVIALDLFHKQWVAFATVARGDEVHQIGPLVYNFPTYIGGT